MGVKNFDQLGLADHFVKQRQTRRRQRLAEIDALIDWSAVSKLLAVVRDPKLGRKGYPPLLMFKALLLAKWNNLSDPALEDALSDRLSFRRFVGLPLDEAAPDETVFVRFRNSLRKHKLEDQVFNEIMRQLDQAGFVLKKGTLIDVTIIEADAKRPSEEDGEVSLVDVDAEFTRKNNKTFFGYKLHIALDQGSGLIRKLMTTGASVHDSLPTRHLVCGDEGAVYADKAYGSRGFRDFLKERGIKDQVMHKATKNKALTQGQRWFNKAVSGIRFEVEQPFGIGKLNYGLARTRYRREERVNTGNYLFAMAYNLNRALG